MCINKRSSGWFMKKRGRGTQHHFGAKYKNSSGYTLVELLVVIAITVGLAVSMIVNRTGSRNSAYLNSAVRQLESALIQAQSYGNSGRVFPTDAPTTDLNRFDKGYGVFVSNANPNRVIIYGGMGELHNNDIITSDEVKYYTGQNQEFEIIQFEGGVSVSVSSGNEAHVLYRRGVNNAIMYGEGGSTPAEITFTLSLGGARIDVVVNKAGLIYVD